MTISEIMQIQLDKRYSVSKEYCGYNEKRYVLRFCGEFVASSEHKNLCLLYAKKHHDKILGV